MNQETAQAEDKCKNIDESNCKNSTLLNLVQKWKKLIDLKNADASRKGSLSLTSSNDPKRKRTSGILLCILFISLYKYNQVSHIIIFHLSIIYNQSLPLIQLAIPFENMYVMILSTILVII